MVTGGATSGLVMVCMHFFRNGDLVFVEDPTYFAAPSILRTELRMNVETGE